MSTQDKAYALAFIFNHAVTHVALIRKARPDWQAGKLNGIGGHVELGEKPIQAAFREIEEECGLQIPPSRLIRVCAMCGGEDTESRHVVYVYTAKAAQGAMLQQKTDEQVSWHCLRDSFIGDLYQYGALPNLDWLVPMCLLKHTNPGWKDSTSKVLLA